jgi:non-heme chloroperoxidase
MSSEKTIARHRLPGTPDPMHDWAGADGLRLAGDAWGDPDAPLVLLLHGGGQTRHAWRGTGEQLGRLGWRAVAFDARGHGDSDWARDGDYSIAANVRDLVALIASLGRRRAALIGASMGGITALVAAGEQQVDAAALILVDFTPTTEPAGVHRVRSFMQQRLDGFDSLEEVAEAIAAYRGEQPARGRDLSGLAKNVRQGSDGRFYWHYDPMFVRNPRDLVESRAHMADCARRLTAPTLLVRGARSDVVSEAGAREFLSLCPHAEFVDVASAGHMVTGDRNDAFGRAAADFLGRKLTGRRDDVQSTAPHPAG